MYNIRLEPVAFTKKEAEFHLQEPQLLIDEAITACDILSAERADEDPISAKLIL